MKLRTPLVPSVSPLTLESDNIKLMEDAGAAVVVFHSLFEEQAEHRGTDLKCGLRPGPDTYLEQIAAAKRSVNIPIIASLNCTAIDGWISYARQALNLRAVVFTASISRAPGGDPLGNAPPCLGRPIRRNAESFRADA